jgi:hypothetical protein
MLDFWPISYLGGNEAIALSFGALVKLTGSNITLTGVVSLPWNSEVYDRFGWHSTTINNTRVTTPSGITLIRATANVLCVTDPGENGILEHRLSGSSFLGQGKCGTKSLVGNDGINIVGAIIPVSSGQYIETDADGMTLGTAFVDEATWCAVEAIDSALKRVLVHKTANQALAAGTTTVLTWNSESYDTDSFHDIATNNSRLTAPATGRFRLIANAASGDVTGQFVLSMIKNGATVVGLPVKDVDTVGPDFVNIVSAPIDFTAGQYAEARAFHTTATNVIAGNSTWFAMEEVPAVHKCALVHKSGTQAISANTVTVLDFAAEIYDDATMHDNTTNNSRIVVPAGCTRARPTFGVQTPSEVDQMVAEVIKNGSRYNGQPRFETNTTGTDSLCGMGAWVDVVPGDYFQVTFFCGTALTLAVNDATFFSLECA